MSEMEIFTCEQNSIAWHRARCGIATASSFDAILTPGKTKTEQKTRRSYMLKRAGEILTGKPEEMVMTRDMERGHLLEPEARDLYTLQTGASLERVGFIRRGRVGCSPDSLIGKDGGLEIKTKAPHLMIDVILKDEFPPEHIAQVQGALWITGRQWWDIAVYWPDLPLFVKRAYRDEVFIANLASEIDRFNDELDAVVGQLHRCVQPEFAAAA
jgi:YqaJ-like recombinase protein